MGSRVDLVNLLRRPEMKNRLPKPAGYDQHPRPAHVIIKEIPAEPLDAGCVKRRLSEIPTKDNLLAPKPLSRKALPAT
jgi:IS5 family transposase